MQTDVMKRNPMPNQEPLVRNKNFKEVALGYDAETAIAEAKRCLDCKHKPCMNGCPVNISIPEFISYVAEGEFEKAYEVISRTSTLPAVCGRVCPQEKQCEAKCVRGIKGDSVSIGRLERFVADYHNANAKIQKLDIERNGKKVAVIGSGPSSLTCAGDLAKMGYAVTVFEALHIAGGVLVYGIPEFRLPKAIVAQEVEGLKAAGVDFKTNVVVGKSISIDDINNFDENETKSFEETTSTDETETNNEPLQEFETVSNEKGIETEETVFEEESPQKDNELSTETNTSINSSK